MAERTGAARRYRRAAITAAVMMMAVWPQGALAETSAGGRLGAAAGDGPRVTYHWVGDSRGSGGDGTSWTDALNWRPHGVPASGDAVEINARPDTDCHADVTAIPDGAVVSSLRLTASQRCDASLTDGSLTVTETLGWSGGDLYTPVTLAHGGRFEAHAFGSGMGLGTTLTISGYMQLIESTLHALNADAVVHVADDGRFDGDQSTIEPLLVNDGRVTTLLPEAAVTTVGGYVQHRSGVLNLVAFSQLSVAGRLDLAGTVTYMTGKRYEAQPGDMHDVLVSHGDSRWHPSCQTTVGRGHALFHWQPSITQGGSGLTDTVTYTAGKVHRCPHQ